MKRWEKIPNAVTGPECINLQPDFTVTAHVWRHGNQIVSAFHRPLIHAPVGVVTIEYDGHRTLFGLFGGVSYEMAQALDKRLREDVTYDD